MANLQKRYSVIFSTLWGVYQYGLLMVQICNHEPIGSNLSMLRVCTWWCPIGCTVFDHAVILSLVLKQPMSQCRASHPEMFGGFECLACSIPPATSPCFLHGPKDTSRGDLSLGIQSTLGKVSNSHTTNSNQRIAHHCLSTSVNREG